MKPYIQQILLQLCDQVIAHPETIPDVPVDAYPEDSDERQIMERFHTMLERIQRSRQDALNSREAQYLSIFTENLRTEEQRLQEKETQYRAIFEASSDGLFIHDEEGFNVEVNPAACKMFGYSYKELPGVPLALLVQPEYYEQVDQFFETIKAGGEANMRAMGLRKDSTPFYIEVLGSKLTYMGKPHVLAVVRDITEQEQAYQLLEQRVEERTHELSTLLEVSHSVAATIELRPLAGLILQKLQEIVNYGGAALAIVEDNDFTFLDYYGPLPPERIAQMRLLFKKSEAHRHVLGTGEPLIITNVYDGSPLAQSLRSTSREYLGEVAADYMHSWMGIPLKSKEHIIGLLSISHPRPNFYLPQHARMAMALASQAAVAIENAHFYEQAQELAAIQERQRLARELHDSVSQALYGISLGTHTARTLLDRDPRKVAEPLDYVLSLTEAALVEMRALIFELRPESLETEGLVSALSKQAAAMQARYNIEVITHSCDEPDVPLKAKQELHRVAQEALHNIVKHAGASKVELRLSSLAEGITLEIEDNGIGFQPEASFPGHLGLHSMRERISNLGGRLQIESAPEHGTHITVWIPMESVFYRRTGTLK